MQMLRILQNKGAVKHKMIAEGVDPEIIEEDPGMVTHFGALRSSCSDRRLSWMLQRSR